LYADNLGKWFNANVAEDWTTLRGKMLSLLSDESELEEIVKMVGMDALSDPDRLKMEASRSIREDFLHQLAFHEVDTYTSPNKMHHMMQLVVAYYEKSLEALNKGANIDDIVELSVRESIGRFKYIQEDKVDEEYANILKTLDSQVALAVSRKEDY
jgi:V/A-type H+-transporting ATPase subunit A